MTKQALKKEKFRPNWHVQWPSNDSNCLDINANCSTGGVKGNLSLRFNDDQVVSYVPQGFVAGADSSYVVEDSVATPEKMLEAKQRQVMAIAYSPGKNLLSTAFMLWMSGSSIQIFSIMMTGMALTNPLKALAGINQAFEKFEKEEGIDLRFPKLVFVALQLLSVGLALYKCSTMGLLPVTSADWTSLLPEKSYMELGVVNT